MDVPGIIGTVWLDYLPARAETISFGGDLHA